tara:strand:+ start:15954 stop:16178 length:225 start_codon:yes stop_codon:yes gene_type:complete
MIDTKEQIQELNAELGELELWEYMRSKNDLEQVIEKRGLYNKSVGEKPSDVLDTFVQHMKEEQAQMYWQDKLDI